MSNIDILELTNHGEIDVATDNSVSRYLTYDTSRAGTFSNYLSYVHYYYVYGALSASCNPVYRYSRAFSRSQYT